MNSTKLLGYFDEIKDMFERYVNFEFYKTRLAIFTASFTFEGYVNFEFYKTNKHKVNITMKFERYVNFEFYKTFICTNRDLCSLRDM